ncbi:hypothetical protein U3516DRAFT_756681 [Neocallimastix sp. 'constans']
MTEDFGLPHIVIWVKETPYRSTLRDPRGKAEPTIGGVLTIPEEQDTISQRQKCQLKFKISIYGNHLVVYLAKAFNEYFTSSLSKLHLYNKLYNEGLHCLSTEINSKKG